MIINILKGTYKITTLDLEELVKNLKVIEDDDDTSNVSNIYFNIKQKHSLEVDSELLCYYMHNTVFINDFLLNFTKCDDKEQYDDKNTYVEIIIKKRCSLCRQIGHNKNKCLNSKTDTVSVSSSTADTITRELSSKLSGQKSVKQTTKDSMKDSAKDSTKGFDRKIPENDNISMSSSSSSKRIKVLCNGLCKNKKLCRIDISTKPCRFHNK